MTAWPAQAVQREGIGSRGFEPWWVWWGLVLLWWTIDAWISVSQIAAMRATAGEVTDWRSVVLQVFSSAYLWVPLTMLALWSSARFPLEREHLLERVSVHLGGTLFVAVFRGGAVALLNPWIGWYAVVPPAGELFMVSVRNNVLIYWLLVGVGHAVHYARAVRAQREQLAEAQLLVLKSQLQPHFLFNALNTVSALVRTDPAGAERTVERLSRLLRHSLESAATQEVSLREELAALEPYVEIEQTRFEDRLIVRTRVAADALDAAVPHLVLQPLVENAVRHGLSRRAQAGCIEIRAARLEDELLIAVTDNGAGLPAGFRLEEHRGVGLRNTQERLSQLYGRRQSLEVESTESGGTEVRLRIPYRTVETNR